MRKLDTERIISFWPQVGLNLLTISVVAYFLASALVALVVSPRLPSADGTAKVAQVIKQVPVPPLNFFAPIWTRNAFKAALPLPPPPPPPPPPKTLDQLAEAKITATLLGTIYSDIDVLSRAIILVGNQQTLMKIGDPLEGFVISEVKRRAIVLKRGSERQLLLIDATDKKIAAKKGEARKMLSRRELKAKLQDLDSLSRDIQLAPATRGKDQGLWVRQLRSGSLFSKAGLQRDDVILKVGGMMVAKGANPVALFGLLEQPQVVVEVLRDGKPLQLVLLLTGN